MSRQNLFEEHGFHRLCYAVSSGCGRRAALTSVRGTLANNKKRRGCAEVDQRASRPAETRDASVVRRIDEIRFLILSESARKLHFERSISRYCENLTKVGASHSVVWQ
eukprot:5747644-Prymnesium_polylepis.1